MVNPTGPINPNKGGSLPNITDINFSLGDRGREEITSSGTGDAFVGEVAADSGLERVVEGRGSAAGVDIEAIVARFSVSEDDSFLRQAAQSAKDTGLDQDQIVGLFGEIVEKCGEYSYEAFRVLPAALESGLTPNQIVGLFGEIVEKCGAYSPEAFRVLPVAFEAAREAGLTADQIVSLFLSGRSEALAQIWPRLGLHSIGFADGGDG